VSPVLKQFFRPDALPVTHPTPNSIKTLKAEAVSQNIVKISLKIG